MSEPLSVYVVEDDDGVMAAVLAALAQPANGFHLVGASPSGIAAAELVADAAIDILVTDLRLPEADGLDIIARAKELRPAVRTVLITGYPSPDLALRAFLAGADAILYKPFNGGELCDALRAALSGQRVLCAEAARHLYDFLRAAQPPAPTLGDDPLSPQEIELLTLLSHDCLLKEAADRMNITYETARTYLKRIFGKYQVHSTRAALSRFRGGGGDFRRAEPSVGR